MANFKPFAIGDDGKTIKSFANLNASDLDELLQAAHFKRTKYSTALLSLSLFTKVSSLDSLCYVIKNIKHFSVLIYTYINTRGNWENSKLCEFRLLGVVFPHNSSFSRFPQYKRTAK